MDELRHFYADVEDVRLHWAELGGATTRTPVVLLHGVADSHLSWRRAAEELARDRLVLMPDLAGCGLSSRPNVSYELQWHAKIIAQWLEQRGLTTVDVVGHSFGGGVSQMLLLECPGRIRRLVLVAAGGLGVDVGFWLKFATFPYFVERWGQPFMAFGTRRARGRILDERDRRDAQTLATMNATGGTARAFSRTVRDVINFYGQRRQFSHRAHEVAVFPPIAVMWGEQDRLIPISHGRAFAAGARGVKFISFPGCGHYVHQDDPVAFVRALREFLDDPNAPAVCLTSLHPARKPGGSGFRHSLGLIARRFQRKSRG